MTMEVLPPTTVIEPILSPTQKAMNALEEKPVDTQAETKEASAEAVKEEAVVEAQPQEDIKAKRFAELSKKEQRILQKQRHSQAILQKREEELVKRESVVKEYEEIKQLAKTNPSEAIKKIGTDYKSLTDHILNGEKLTPELVHQDVNNKIKELEEKLATQGQQLLEREEKRKEEENARILKTFSASIVETVNKNAEKYPAVHAFEGAPVIYEIVQQRWHQTGGKHLLTIEEAAGILEKDLSRVVSKLIANPAYMQRFTSSKKSPQPNSLNKPSTITNDMTSSSPSFLPQNKEDDRMKRALEKLM